MDTVAPLQCVHQPAQPTAALLPHPHPNRSTIPPTSTITTSITRHLRCQLHQLCQLWLLLRPLFTANSTSGNTFHLHHHAPAPCLLHHQSWFLPHHHLAHPHAIPQPPCAHHPAHLCVARNDQDKAITMYIQEHCDRNEDAGFGAVLWCFFMISSANTATTPRKRPEKNIKP